MNTFTVVMTVIAGIMTILSVIFAILAFARNKTKDSNENTARLVKIETDIQYIRQSLDERREWERDIETRIRKLENRGNK